MSAKQKSTNSLFGDILGVRQALIDLQRQQSYRGIFLGKVCHIREDGAVRVIQLNDQSSYVTYWLKPTNSAKGFNTAIDDLVLFCYIFDNPKNGVYLDLFDSNKSNGLSQEQAETLILSLLAQYDQTLKTFVSTNYVDNAELASFNYTTLAAVQTWVNTQLTRYTSRYIEHRFYDLASGTFDIPSHWIDKQVSITVNNATGTFNLGVRIGIANNNLIGFTNRIYIKNTFASTALPLTSDSGVNFNSNLTTFQIQPQTQVEIKKGTSNLNYTVTQIIYTNNPYG